MLNPSATFTVQSLDPDAMYLSLGEIANATTFAPWPGV